MKLASIKAENTLFDDNKWNLDECYFGSINLIVGKNSTGKSRLLNFIHTLSNVIRGARAIPTDSTNYIVRFEADSSLYEYNIKYANQVVLEEKLTLNNDILLRRESSGKGILKTRSIKSPDQIPATGPIDFQTTSEKENVFFSIEQQQVAVFAKRDAIMSPDLEPIWHWANALKKYDFNDKLGQTSALNNSINSGPFDFRDQNAVIAMYSRAVKEFQLRFKNLVIEDMEKIGYLLDDIKIDTTHALLVPGVAPEALSTLQVKEAGVPFYVEHVFLSTGMFRALSLIVQVNYSKFYERTTTILVDDIGEGLDYDRSTRLIDYLVRHGEDSNLQVIMTTNDRFVMNAVPLKYWCVLERDGYSVKMIDLKSFPNLVDRFDYTGLSNFDFFAMDFHKNIRGDESR